MPACSCCKIQIATIWAETHTLCYNCIMAQEKFLTDGVKYMDKQAALKRLDAIEEEAKKLRAIIDNKNTRFLPYPQHTCHMRIDGDNYYYVKAIPVFKTDELAKDFAEAFQVMLELHACDGVVCIKENITAYEIYFHHKSNTINAKLVSLKYLEGWVGRLAPYFDTAINANSAIAKVRKERIIKAIKTLAWIE